MNNILEDLKKYFRDTPREKVMKDWSETKNEAPKGGPTLRKYLEASKIYYRSKKEEFFVIKEKNTNLVNPKYPSGSFFSKI
ncbi:hypothetical protein [Flavobacterium sp. N1719]|uniref:hypothetical protein n=1 Tax=Flavobacterium sp. N1719 TaxID=2885633 RepID=UPI0022217B62|nr:hypothetical protein [Flavobacterium sp. N1719]